MLTNPAARDLLEHISILSASLEEDLAADPSNDLAKLAVRLYGLRLKIIMRPDDETALDELGSLIDRIERMVLAT